MLEFAPFCGFCGASNGDPAFVCCDQRALQQERLQRPDRRIPDAKFPTDNEFDIPLLSREYEARWLDLPVAVWGSVKRTAQMPGTWHFYTDDYRFERIWERPYEVPETGCMAVIEPNFTISEQMSRATVLYNIYRKRWLARYWQTFGIRVLVDLNVSVNRYEVNFLGVPVGWKAYATRGYTERLDDLKYEFEIACKHAWSEEILFVVVGGGQAVKSYCEFRGWTHIQERADIVREQRRE